MPKKQLRRIIDTKKTLLGVRVAGGGSGGDAHTHPNYALTTTQIATGDGLQGGGDLSANRTLSVDSSVVRTSRQVNAGVGLTGGGPLSANVTLTLGTALDTEFGQASSVAAGQHRHGVVSLNDVAGPLAGPGLTSLLHANLGYLKLRQLDVEYGDFKVRSENYNPLFVVHTANENVGIGTAAPDPQFLLDVKGPARAEVFVGPHAIQLDDALLISHFDGVEDNPNHFGEVNGHRGQIGDTGNKEVFVRGRFNKAFSVNRATTNYMKNPGFNAYHPTTYAPYHWSPHVGGATVVYDPDGARVGHHVCRVGAFVSETPYIWQGQIVSVPNNAHISCSAWVRLINETNVVKLAIRAGGTDRVDFTTAQAVKQHDDWYYLTATWQNTTGSAVTAGPILSGISGASMAQWDVDAVQCELSAFSTNFCWGDFPDSTWSGGAAHSATANSVRASYNYVSYPSAGNVSDIKGTMMAWVFVPGISNTGVSNIFFGTGAIGNALFCGINSSGNFITYYGNGYTNESASALSYVGKWFHVAITWNRYTNRAYTYVNGQRVNPAASGAQGGVPYNTAPAHNIAAGALSYAVSYNLNGLIDDFAVTAKDMSADEILAVYESKAPVFAESSTFSFRATPEGLVWADQRGLWVKKSGTGAGVLGVNAGKTAHTWGGLSLEPGDLLIGSSPNYLLARPSTNQFIISGGGGGVQIDGTNGLELICGTSGDFFDIARSITWRRLGDNPLRIYSGYSADGTINYSRIAHYASNIGTFIISSQDGELQVDSNLGGSMRNRITMIPHVTGTGSTLDLRSLGNIRIFPDVEAQFSSTNSTNQGMHFFSTTDVFYLSWANNLYSNFSFAASAATTFVQASSSVRLRISGTDKLSVVSEFVSLPSVPLKWTHLGSNPSMAATLATNWAEVVMYAYNYRLVIAYKNASNALRYITVPLADQTSGTATWSYVASP